MARPRGLYVNCTPANCSIYESGVMFARALEGSSLYELDYLEAGSFEEIPRHYDFYAFNYHHVTMSWLDPMCIEALPGRRIAFVLEMEQDDPFVLCPDVFDAYCVPDPILSCADPRVHAFGRPLEVVPDLPSYVDPGIPVIGSFGFATPGKGFEVVVHVANKEFDRAIVRLNIPPATHADPSGEVARRLGRTCRELAKPGIEVRVDHRYLDKRELIDWCAGNTVNVFLYHRRQPGLAATTDQAITAGRPLLVSPCDTFRHIHPYLRPYPGTSLREAIEGSGPGVLAMQRDWHPDRFRSQFEELLVREAPPAVVEAPAARIHLGILTHNALDYSKSCLEHIRRHTAEPYRIYVLDNASNDGTREWLAGLEDPRIQVRLSDENHGVAGGRNRLMCWILPELPGDGFLVFLDNDIDVGEGWTRPYLRLFEERPEAGIAGRSGSLMLVHEDRRQLLRGPTRTSPVDVVSGGFACWIRKQVCLDVGEFDEELGLFWQEDDDYAVRAIQLGWEVFCVPEATMLHHEHRSGVAQDQLEKGGSPENARYLAEKWRELGFIDEEGWVRHPQSSVYLPLEVRRDLQRRLGKNAPFDRRQFADALSQVHEAIVDPGIVGTWPRKVMSRLHWLLLDVFEDQAREDGDEELKAGVPRARAALRGRDLRDELERRLDCPEAPKTAPLGRRRLSKLCAAEDWNDPPWRREAEEIHWDPSGPGYHHRSKDIWLLVQLQHGLRSLGCLHDGARGLVYMAEQQPLIWSLCRHVRQLVAIDDYTERGERSFVADPVAPADFPGDRLELIDSPGLPFADASFDFVVAPTMYSRIGEPALVAERARELARVARPAAVLAFGYFVVVSPGEALHTPERAVELLTRGSGCDLLEEPELRISGETLEGHGEGLWDYRCAPYLLHCDGQRVLTNGVLFLTKPVLIPRGAAPVNFTVPLKPTPTGLGSE